MSTMIDCDHDWKFADDSFDHEFGCEVVRFMRCEKCDATKECDDDGPDEPDYDQSRPLTPLENWQRNDEHNQR